MSCRTIRGFHRVKIFERVCTSKRLGGIHCTYLMTRSYLMSYQHKIICNEVVYFNYIKVPVICLANSNLACYVL